jgi:hypothetical protein
MCYKKRTNDVLATVPLATTDTTLDPFGLHRLAGALIRLKAWDEGMDEKGSGVIS